MIPSTDSILTTIDFIRLRVDHVLSAALKIVDPLKSKAHRDGELSRLRAAAADVARMEELVIELEAAVVALNANQESRELVARTARAIEADQAAQAEAVLPQGGTPEDRLGEERLRVVIAAAKGSALAIPMPTVEPVIDLSITSIPYLEGDLSNVQA